MKSNLIPALAASVVLAFGATAAQAATAIYTITGHADGSLNGVDFTNAGFTFTLYGDTANLSDDGSVQKVDPLDQSNVVIEGFSGVTLQIPTSLRRLSGGTETVLDGVIGGNLRNLLLWTTVTPVDFGHSFGPVGSNLVEIIGNTFDTSGGALQFDNANYFDGQRPITISAVVRGDTGVPEPATWAMMLIGFGGMGAMLRRRRFATAA
ncbi:MAG TPA: PEPxxWA-CTERM sorting domain-containing protein [Phenylobacterium sp.]